MEEERKQYTFYVSFARAVSRIRNKEDRCDAYDAITNYALFGIEPDTDNLSDAAAIAFELAKPTLDTSKRKAASGKSGGVRKQSGSNPEASRKQTAREKEKEKEVEVEKENECSLSPTPLSEKVTKKDRDFEAFWVEYPRKQGKQAARKAFEKVKVPVSTLISAVQTQKKSQQWLQNNGQYIPNPTTWLNQGRWEDELQDSHKGGVTNEWSDFSFGCVATLEDAEPFQKL